MENFEPPAEEHTNVTPAATPASPLATSWIALVGCYTGVHTIATKPYPAIAVTLHPRDPLPNTFTPPTSEKYPVIMQGEQPYLYPHGTEDVFFALQKAPLLTQFASWLKTRNENIYKTCELPSSPTRKTILPLNTLVETGLVVSGPEALENSTYQQLTVKPAGATPADIKMGRDEKTFLTVPLLTPGEADIVEASVIIPTNVWYVLKTCLENPGVTLHTATEEAITLFGGEYTTLRRETLTSLPSLIRTYVLHLDIP